MSQPSNVFVAYLAQKLEAGGSETTIYLDRVTTLTGEAIATGDFADFTRGILTINPDGDGDSSYPEYVSFTGVDASAKTLTGVIRGLSSKSNSLVTANKRFHPSRTPVLLSFGSHQIQDIIDYIDAQIATLTIGSNVASLATAGEDLTAGELVYLKSDGKWWLCDADTVATINAVILGICQTTTSADASITDGVLLKGVDTNQTGMTLGEIMYASNTAGAISSSVGTSTKAIGVARTASNLYFDPYFVELPSSAEKAALVGDGVTPLSTENHVVTKYDHRFGVNVRTAGATIAGATLPVPVYQNSTDNEFYACDANDTAAMRFLGFAVSDSTDGNPIDVQFTGIVPGFTGLTEGVNYYLQDAVGTIGTTVGTNEVLVGIAISETELLIQKGKRSKSGTFSIAGVSGSLAVDCGFRINKINILSVNGSSTVGIFQIGRAVWTNNGWSSISLGDTSRAFPVLSNSAGDIFSDPSDGDKFRFTITSITDTGFTITWTEVGSSGSFTCHYEAEGEI